jgi:hypothetical protein
VVGEREKMGDGNLLESTAGAQSGDIYSYSFHTPRQVKCNNNNTNTNMSTIASPRPSFALSSRRGSASTDNTVLSAPGSKSTAADRAALRRNRAALRDYYNLQASSTPSDIPSPPPTDPSSEFDKPDFSPSSYVQHLLATEGLEGVLRVEAGLLSDIRSLDGEKKALVYDNYSKLIKATDTIRCMREKMDPMMPGTSTLGPAIGHIAESAAGLRRGLRREGAGGGRREEQREVVRWVLGAPERLRGMEDEEPRREEWGKVRNVLERWGNVKGVEDVRQKCLEAVGGSPEG